MIKKNIMYSVKLDFKTDKNTEHLVVFDDNIYVDHSVNIYDRLQGILCDRLRVEDCKIIYDRRVGEDVYFTYLAFDSVESYSLRENNYEKLYFYRAIPLIARIGYEDIYCDS